MTGKQIITNIRAAQRTLTAQIKEVERLQSEIETSEARLDELTAIEKPTKAQIDEQARLERSLPFLPSKLEREEVASQEAKQALESALATAWPHVEAVISASEAEQLELAAQAVLPWCGSLELARNRAEQLPAISRLNHLARELMMELESGKTEEVAAQVIELLEAAEARETAAKTK